jgi:hypothetical protein
VQLFNQYFRETKIDTHRHVVLRTPINNKKKIIIHSILLIISTPLEADEIRKEGPNEKKKLFFSKKNTKNTCKF